MLACVCFVTIFKNLFRNASVKNRLVLVILLFVYSIILILTLFFTKESPISIFPYPNYFHLESPEFSRGVVLSRTQNDQIEESNHDLPTVEGLDYLEYSAFQSSSLKHSKNYFLPTLISKTFSIFLNMNKINKEGFFYKLPIFLFFSVPVSFLVIFIVFIWRSKANDADLLRKNLIVVFVFSILFTLALLRIVFGFGYPESFIGIPRQDSVFNFLKGLVGPSIAPQGHIGIWGIEPRNSSMFAGILSVLLLLLGSNFIKASLALLILSILISTSQGLLFVFPFLYFMAINKKHYKLFIYFLLFIFAIVMHMLSDSIFNPFVLITLLLFMNYIRKINISNLKTLSRVNISHLNIFYLFTYIFILVITYYTNILLLVDSVFLNFLPFSQSEFYQGTYALWGRGFIQEYPGRIGSLILVLFLYRMLNLDFIRVKLQNVKTSKIILSKNIVLFFSIFTITLINLMIYIRITSML